MKIVKISFIICIFFGFVSCKNKEKLKKEDTITQIPPPPPPLPIDTNNVKSESVNVSKSENYRLHVSFISIGQGIDDDMRQKFIDWVNNFPKKIAFEEAFWGREGEADYCFKLSEFSASEQEDFIKKAKELLLGSNLVNINENVPCSHKK